MTRYHLSLLALLLFPSLATAQNALQRAATGIALEAEGNVAATGSNATPFWLSANRHGLASVRGDYGYLRTTVQRTAASDTAENHRWRLGYGLTLAAGYHLPANVTLQQCYGEVEWVSGRLTLGAKERTSELKNARLSTGGLTLGSNAAPVPQLRIELPRFWNIPGTHGWLALRGHIAYGRFADNGWKRDFTAPNATRAEGVWYHSKAGFVRVGNPERFPLTLTGGLEMAAQFGGEAWNVLARPDDHTGFTGGGYINMNGGVKDFWHAFIPGGSDATDAGYDNASGNQLGSWHAALDYQGKGWSARLYAEHYFEDHSQMFLEYGWKDMLLGAEVSLPRNPFVSTLVYEHLRTTDQTGGIYHDATPQLPVQISGADQYYAHNLYGAWQHRGYMMGNPLLLSPLYNSNGLLIPQHTRITAHHFGIEGQPLPTLGYRALFTHTRSLGTYSNPTLTPLYGNYYLAELHYAPAFAFARGLSLIATLAGNGGALLGRSTAGMLTLRYRCAVR